MMDSTVKAVSPSDSDLEATMDLPVVEVAAEAEVVMMTISVVEVGT